MAGNHYPPGEDQNFYVVRTDANGDTLWTKSIGGDQGEYVYCIQPTADTGYVIIGRTNSYGAGANDIYVVKLSPDRASPTGIGEDDAPIPLDFTLGQNYPNPFNAGTRIDYVLQRPGRVQISVYNLLGQHVRTLYDDVRQAGRGSILWDGCDDAGRILTSGIYFYRLRFGREVITRRMLLLK